eukprot:g26074.t1
MAATSSGALRALSREERYAGGVSDLMNCLDEQLRPEPRLCWDFETLQAHLQQQRRRQAERVLARRLESLRAVSQAQASLGRFLDRRTSSVRVSALKRAQASLADAEQRALQEARARHLLLDQREQELATLLKLSGSLRSKSKATAENLTRMRETLEAAQRQASDVLEEKSYMEERRVQIEAREASLPVMERAWKEVVAQRAPSHAAQKHAVPGGPSTSLGCIRNVDGDGEVIWTPRESVTAVPGSVVGSAALERMGASKTQEEDQATSTEPEMKKTSVARDQSWGVSLFATSTAACHDACRWTRRTRRTHRTRCAAAVARSGARSARVLQRPTVSSANGDEPRTEDGGPLHVDTYHVGPMQVDHQPFGMIREMSGEVFASFPFEGILGLAFPSLSFAHIEPFFERVIKNKLLRQNEFAFYLNVDSNRPSALLWGGVDKDLYEGDIVMFPVVKPHYWALELVDFRRRIGNRSLLGKKPTYLIVDTGTTYFTAPESIYGAIMDSFPEAPCSHVEKTYLPLTYVLRSGPSSTWDLKVSQETYMVGDDADNCMPAFMRLDIKKEFGPAMILGEVFMRHFFTVFSRGSGDLNEAKVGFAPAKLGQTPKVTSNSSFQTATNHGSGVLFLAMAGDATVDETAAEVKVKTEKPADSDEVVADPAGFLTGTVKIEEREDLDAKVKQEKKEEEKENGQVDAVKGEGVKGEGVKQEGNVKQEKMRSEEDVKNEMKMEGTKREDFYALATKGEGAKGEVKGETKGEIKGEGVKGESKRERSRSKKKKKKDQTVVNLQKLLLLAPTPTVNRGDSVGSPVKWVFIHCQTTTSQDKKRKKSESPGGTRKRKSKWGPDTGGFSMSAMPGGRSGLLPAAEADELMPQPQRLHHLPGELIEFFNGAILAVTGNAVHQAANRNMSPVFACTITEEDSRSSKRKTAELKFRTPDGASVGMKLNGIEYKGHKVTVKRPDAFTKPSDGQDHALLRKPVTKREDPSVKINLHEMSMAKMIGGATDSRGMPMPQGPSPKLSIFNLPDAMTEQICRDLLSQMLSLIRDLGTGKIKGYGIFEYDNPNDVDLAIVALNGFVCGQNVIRVQKLGQQSTTTTTKPQPVAATAMPNSMTQKIVKNPVLAMQVKQGREVGSRPSTVVQLMNAVYQEDVMDDQDYDDITSEVHAEASKHGNVMRVVIPKPAKDGTYVDGVGKIFVAGSRWVRGDRSEEDLTAARKFQMDANGRKFENRVVCAAFYPVEKFNEGKFKLWSA